MAAQNETTLISQAWMSHRQSNHEQAITEFRSILNSFPSSIDAYYGLGLAQRAAGQIESSINSFQTAMRLASEKLSQLRADAQANENDLQSSEDDRYMMLVRMVGQRLVELGVDPRQN